MKHAVVAALLLFAIAPISAQQSTSAAPATDPVLSAARQMQERFARNLVGAAEEMPADKYGFRPTPDQMTFGHLMVHVAEANNMFCGAIGGTPARETKLADTDTKDVLTTAVKDSFTVCQQALAKADDTKLGQPVALSGGQTTTRAAALLRLIGSWGDHYSAAAMYLRLNNLVPPSAQKSK